VTFQREKSTRKSTKFIFFCKTVFIRRTYAQIYVLISNQKHALFGVVLFFLFTLR